MMWQLGLGTTILAAVAGIANGVSEAMTMIRPPDAGYRYSGGVAGGVRNHRWFRHYHLVDWMPKAGAFFLGAVTVIVWPVPVVLAGAVAVTLWECTELGYSLGRYRSVLPPSEHIVLVADTLSMTVSGWLVPALHGVRILVMIVLTIATIMEAV